MTTATLVRQPPANPSAGALENRLDSIRGPFAKVVPLFEPGTIQHADLVTNARFYSKGGHQEYRTYEGIVAADVALYMVVKDEPMLTLARGYDYRGELVNPFLKSPVRIAKILKEKEEAKPKSGRWLDDEYVPSDDEMLAFLPGLVNDVTVKLADVVTHGIPIGYGNDMKYGLLEIDTANSEAIVKKYRFSDERTRVALNKSQRAVAERVFGKGDDYVMNLAKFRAAGIKSVKLSFLHPNYVKAYGAPIAGLCWISDVNMDEINLSYDFHAAGGSTSGKLVGVPKVDYIPVRAMLDSNNFHAEGFGRSLPRRAIRNMAQVIDEFMSNGPHTRSWGVPLDYAYERHGHGPSFREPKQFDYVLLKGALASPEFPLRMRDNTNFRMADHLFKTVRHYALSGRK